MGSAGFVLLSHIVGVPGLLGFGVNGCAVEPLDPVEPLESLNDLDILSSLPSILSPQGGRGGG